MRFRVVFLCKVCFGDEKLAFPDLLQGYTDGIWKTYEIYIFHLFVMLKVAQYAEKDAEIRAAKLLPSDEDKTFSPQIYTNPCTQSLANHVDFLKIAESYKANEDLDEDHIRRLYHSFCETEEFQTYRALENPTDKDHAKMLLELYRFLTSQDMFVEMTEDRYNNWQDDESLVVGAMKKTLKTMPLEGAFYEDFQPSDETVQEFGEQLLRKTCQEDEPLFEIISPNLKNWDADRVAILDMIMLKMALCELLHFPTIPTKVTLNEYVEISKSYSTENSKDFINGILDRLMKKLLKEEKIVKEGRGLIE